MFRKRHGPPGSAPATLVPHTVEGRANKPAIQVAAYDGQHLSERECADIGGLPSEIPSTGVTWINIDGLGDVDLLKQLGERFKLHPLALEDVLNTGQRPKIEHAADYVFIVAQMIYQDGNRAFQVEQVSLFLGANFLITIQEEGEYDVFEPVRQRLRAGRGMIRRSGADYLAYALLDSIVDHYFPVLDDIGEAVEDLEDSLLEKPSRDMVVSLHDYRRSFTHIRRFVWPLREVMSGLLHDSGGFVREPTRVFLRDCYDHTVQLMDLVESYKELTSGLTDLYHSSVGLRTNEIMRVLTVITAIFIPLTFVVGIYGMNFAPRAEDGTRLPLNMPELHHPYGYVAVMAVMFLIAIGQLLIFRKLRWL
ncbi:MAG TPA: magnesium/cobalt transporter CorA [Luteolibacter sp.]|nr:magnesium/cobalt transporter CorA [Luteolibacter sp.]